MTWIGYGGGEVEIYFQHGQVETLTVNTDCSDLFFI